jgi:hypothetical protein
LPRFVLVVTTTLVLAALLAWYLKGDLEMGWIAVGPIIVGVTAAIALGLAWILLPPGFPRAAAALAAFPFGVLFAWLAMSTPNAWYLETDPAHLEAANAIAADPARVQAAARRALDMPVEIEDATVNTTPGMLFKLPDRFGFDRRPAAVQVTAGFAIGPYGVIRLDVLPADTGWTLSAGSLPEAGRISVRPSAIQRRYPDVPLVEVGGPDPFVAGALAPLRLMRAEDDWAIAIVRIMADGEPLAERRRLDQGEIEERIRAAVRREGLSVERIVTYFRPAGLRVMFMAAPAFDFNALLREGGSAQVQARLEGDTIGFTVVSIRGTPTGRTSTDRGRTSSP